MVRIGSQQQLGKGEQGKPKPNLYEDEPQFQEVFEYQRESLIEQAKQFHQSYEQFKKKDFFSHSHLYLISTRWLKRWKRFVSYEEVINERPLLKLLGCGALPHMNEDIIEERDKNIIEYDDYDHKYLNVRLKPDLMEARDFEYLDESTWEILYQRNNGTAIKRFVVEGNDGKIVELYYKKIPVVPIVSDILKDIEHERTSKLNEVNVYFSKYDTVANFIEIAGRAIKRWVEGKKSVYIASENFMKLWMMPQKLRKPILFNTLMQGCKANPSFTYKLFLDGELIPVEGKVGELEIVKDTIIIAQFRQVRQNWIFYNLTHKLKAQCSCCRREEELNYVCSCKYAVYCSKQCKAKDKTTHKWRCPNQAESEEEQKELSYTENSKRGLAGLRNLGNTCFMNSGLQCLSHIPELTEYFLSKSYVKDINRSNPLGTQGQLSLEYAKMVENLWFGEENSFSPHKLKKSIGKFQPMFSGYQQHDSGELITYLLDGLHEDLNRVKDKPYTEIKDYDGRPDEVIAKEAWETFLKRNQSIVVDLMYGQYKSKVECPNQNCRNISITFDPFSVCSLPLVNKSVKKIELTFVKEYIYSKKVYFPFSMQREYTLKQKLGELRDLLGIEENKKVVIYSSSYSSCELVKQSMFLSDIKSQFNFRSLYVRQLNDYQDPEKDIKIMVANVTKSSYSSDSSYRKSISPYHLFYVNPQSTNKQVYQQIIGYYAKIANETFESDSQFQSKFINAEKSKQICQILLIPISRYYTCGYCDNKNCNGCKLPYDDRKFSEYVKYNPESEYDREKKIEIELFWRKDERDVERLFDSIKEQNQNYFKNVKDKNGKSSQANKDTISIRECLRIFEKEEILGEDNAWYCPKCKDFVLAKKEMKIYKAPKVLVLCLKRFKRKNYFSEKIGSLVDFPIEGLDMTEFISNNSLPEDYFRSESAMEIERNNAIYDLIAISNHFGSTGGGHYTAYCKQDAESGQWFDFDDSSVRRLREVDSIVSESAYILFYKRRV